MHACEERGLLLSYVHRGCSSHHTSQAVGVAVSHGPYLSSDAVGGPQRNRWMATAVTRAVQGLVLC
jgi:hypothetical protein